MSETATKIKIANVAHKQQPSKFKEGETYTITNIQDEISGRKGSAMGAWAENWKQGDVVEGIWEEKTYKDKDGFDQKSWSIKDPNKKPWTGGKGGYTRGPSIVDAYMIAATLAPVLYAGKKIKLNDIEELANAVKAKLDAATPKEAAATPAAAPKEEVKSIDVTKESQPSTLLDEETEEDDDKPF